jgi:hypothetical protein
LKKQGITHHAGGRRANKLGLTGTILVETFAKTGDEIRRKDEDNTQGKKNKGSNLVFSPKLVHKGISHPVLDLPYLPAHIIH